MVTFEQIKNANESIHTTDIKGKAYAEVNQRIKAFRIVYPDGIIETDMVSNENGVCIFRAKVGYYERFEDGCVGINWLSTGTAYEKESSSFINKTSYIENCETSAVGRALGLAGFGIDTSVASYEEVANAIENQKPKKLATQQQIKHIVDNTTAEQLRMILDQKKVKTIEELTEEQAGAICIKLNERKMKELEA